jgi:hypothetical protein
VAGAGRPEDMPSGSALSEPSSEPPPAAGAKPLPRADWLTAAALAFFAAALAFALVEQAGLVAALLAAIGMEA